MIIFNHMKRSGGTFIWRDLARFFNVAVCNDRLEIHISGNTASARTAIEVLVGHDVFHDVQISTFVDCMRKRKPDNRFYFTVLRHPVDVVYSWARHRYPRENPDMDIQSWVAHTIDRVLGGWTYWQEYYRITPDMYDFVGITEEMPAVIRHLNRRLGIQIANIPKNVSFKYGDKEDMDSYRRDEMLREFAENIAIYNTCRERFEQKYV